MQEDGLVAEVDFGCLPSAASGLGRQVQGRAPHIVLKGGRPINVTRARPLVPVAVVSGATMLWMLWMRTILTEFEVSKVM